MEYINKMQIATRKAKPVVLSQKALAALGSIFGKPAEKATPRPADPPRRPITVDQPQYDNGGIIDRLMSEMRRQRGEQ